MTAIFQIFRDIKPENEGDIDKMAIVSNMNVLSRWRISSIYLFGFLNNPIICFKKFHDILFLSITHYN